MMRLGEYFAAQLNEKKRASMFSHFFCEKYSPLMRSNNHHGAQWDMRNCNGGYLDDYEVFKNGPFQR